MDELRLRELEDEIRDQYALLARLQTAVRQQEERLAALRGELETLRRLLSDEGAAGRSQNELPF